MNANELADNLEKHNLLSGYACMAADLLRQQQAEIEALRRHREWIEETAVKELTDEEIWKLWVKHLNDDIIVFARELLRKANKK